MGNKYLMPLTSPPSILPAAAPELFEATRTGRGRQRAIKVFILESSPVIGRTLKALLERSPALSCAAVHVHLAEALRALPEGVPDILLADGRMLCRSAAGLVPNIKKNSPATQILFLTNFFDTGGLVFEAVCAGASGDLQKSTPAALFVQTLQWVYDGGSPMSMAMAHRVAAHFKKRGDVAARAGTLSPLEDGIVTARANGTPYQAIAEQLNLSVPAVLTHLRRVCEKLNARSLSHETRT